VTGPVDAWRRSLAVTQGCYPVGRGAVLRARAVVVELLAAVLAGATHNLPLLVRCNERDLPEPPDNQIASRCGV
jgi:hypothetical protein